MLKADLVRENDRLRAEVLALRAGLEGVDRHQAAMMASELAFLRVEVARLRAGFQGMVAAQKAMASAIGAFVSEAPELAYQDMGDRKDRR